MIRTANAVSDSEPLARFLTSSTHYSSAMQSVKPAAFLPPPKRDLSVFRVHGLTTDQICQIGEQAVISRMTGRTLHGFASIVTQAFEDVRLCIDPDDTPPRHASVTGWPADKAERKMIAIQLAARARLVTCSVG